MERIYKDPALVDPDQDQAEAVSQKTHDDKKGAELPVPFDGNEPGFAPLPSPPDGDPHPGLVKKAERHEGIEGPMRRLGKIDKQFESHNNRLIIRRVINVKDGGP